MPRIAFNKYYKFFFFAILLFLLSKAFSYQRWLGFDQIPKPTIFDERDYAYAGYTFRKTGIPTAWSTMDVYKILDVKYPINNRDFDGLSITFDNKTPSFSNRELFNYPKTHVIELDVGKGKEQIRLVQPFLDHPIFGSYIFSLGIKNNPQFFDQIRVEDFRQVSVYVSIVTAVLLFLFSYLLYGNFVISLFAFIIYSTIPTFILSSRYALLENLLIPFYLLSLSFLLLYQKLKNKPLSWLFLLLSGVSTGLAFLTKEAGIFILFASILFLFKNKLPPKKYLLILLPFTLITLIYYSYAFLLSPELLSKLLFDQANRGFFGPLNFLFSITMLRFEDFPIDSYWLWGAVSLLIIVLRNPKVHQVLSTSFVSFLVVYLILGGLNYPWYILPFLPIFITAAAYELYHLFTSPTIVSLSSLFLLAFPSSFYWGYMVHNEGTNTVSVYRLFLLFYISITILIHTKYIQNKYFKLIWPLIFLAIIYQMNKWNLQSFQYMISNWDNFPAHLSIK